MKQESDEQQPTTPNQRPTDNSQMKRALILAGGGARGAFQVGVLQFLEEMNWKPDLICGSSVGAINAVGVGSGVGLAELAHIWNTYNRQRMYSVTLPKFLSAFLSRRRYSPLMDTGAMRAVLAEHMDIDALRRSRTNIVITAVNLRTSQLAYFDNSVITIDHVMASSAMPVFFPYQLIDGEPYWDGGMMANAPIIPAWEYGAEEIIVVLLSPVGAFERPLPQTIMQAAELAFEHFLIGSYATLSSCMPLGNIRMGIVSPARPLGFRSLLNFSLPQAYTLLQEGYENAEKQLKDFLNL